MMDDEGDPDDILEFEAGCVVRMRRENLIRLMRALWFRRQYTGRLDFTRAPAHLDLCGELSGRDIGDLIRAVYVSPASQASG